MKNPIRLVLLCVTAAAFTLPAYAGPNRELSFQYGVISDEGQMVAFPSTKFYSISTRDDISIFTTQYEIGGINDNNPGRNNTFFGFASVGLETKTEPFFATLLTGSGFITAPDAKLSSVFEFIHTASVGFKDKRGVAIDLGYRHISNAGLWPPNIGRNFVVLRLTIPWSYVF